MSEFARNLKKYRLAKGLSQEELSRRAGVHVVQFSRYERGHSTPSIEVVQKLAEALEIPIDTLVYGDAHEQIEQATTDRELVLLFKKVALLDEQQKATIKDFLQAFIFRQEVQEKLV